MFRTARFLTTSLDGLGLILLAAACDFSGGGGLTPVTLATDGSAGAAGQSYANRKISATAAKYYGDGKMLWHYADGNPNGKGRKVFAALKAASAHGLRADSYLPADLLALDKMQRRSREQALKVDRAITQGLYELVRDFTYGRFNENRPLGSGTFASALKADDIHVWFAENEPKGKSYADLRKQLRSNGGLSPTQRSLIALNMERLRWVPEAEYGVATIRVNIADQILEAFNGTSREDVMRVVIGREERPTPLLNDPIRDLKFSPDWTVPETIIEKDFLPKLKKNPRAFDPDKYEILVNGVPPWEVENWDEVEPEDVFIRRAASDNGPLGGVRFSMYNSDAIFLHDTANKALFSREFRAYSSGCVRVQRAEDLSVWIMKFQNPALSQEEIAARMGSGKTTSFKLSQRVQANLQYMTAYIDGENKLRFTPDPYSWDRPLARKLGLGIAPSSAAAVPQDLEYDISP